MSPAYHLKNVAYDYGGPSVLEIPDLTLPAGRVTALVGPNGAGKSTLLHLLAFVDPPRTGEIRFFGEFTADREPVALRRRVGLVPQNPYLLRGSARENVEMGLKLRRVSAASRHARAERALEQVGVLGLAERPAGALSGGEAQKVALARALVLDPEVLLLDEPFTYLDPASIDELEGLMRTLNREQGHTVILTSHDLVRAQALADTVLSLVAGHLMSTSLVNLFRGRLDTARGVFDTGRIAIEVPEGVAAGTHLAIEPRDVVLSGGPLASSMRNRFEGRVTSIAEENGRVRVTVNAGERFHAIITRASLAEHALELGTPVWVSFKSTAVEVF
ncbi:MAG: ATP-binding cassette domain-containing protein [Gammaproteobacteria bacterium]|nr:ATP-binding cassette domain-containing protein [Gammaproteobacteria bacterium]NIR82824.1 ATP-binding cassette domain-containing protein [Gammaproteobacteria bacterium]NIR89933.1 ATP-binding cassette domain-containing protein [Gammaproteobacteria bacterium]NIU03982.1 ATP-binding cassette domain-containing protein [Gammaproteobacteria bacterium]NIV51302.1 ATP-binding cassette domain-containing protein [Gammaproteobacteria bacterium]